jgi:ribosomal RNA assembly protein
VSTKISTMIPHERVGVVLGRDGATKTEIERAFKVKLKVSSDTGTIEVTSSEDNDDPSTILRARDVVTALGRGFSPDRAMTLVDDDAVLDVIDLRELFGKSERDINRIKGRVIGSEGKMRRLLEEMTDAKVSVYGDTITTIGEFESVSAARQAIEMLIKGKQHSSVYKFLRRTKTESKKRKTLELWENPPR